MSLIEKHTKEGSLYYTDEHIAYASLKLRGKNKPYLIYQKNMLEMMHILMA
ncbi:MAG: hypothetical protein KatS3mg003_1172 [Candidatus Nitrosocaldaceae archaeon]|nr:MAG: hypothetical protein KatS3mg003_1172 [Candidatus Nitrosocaldaceae archaeon]